MYFFHTKKASKACINLYIQILFLEDFEYVNIRFILVFQFDDKLSNYILIYFYFLTYILLVNFFSSLDFSIEKKKENLNEKKT